MNFPESLWYTKDHGWIRFEGDEAFIGITAFAKREFGNVIYVDIPLAENDFFEGEVFGTIEAVKTISDLCMPISGKILEVNPALESQSEMVNTRPYDVWMIRIRLSDPEGNEGLLTAQQYRELVGKG